MKTELEKDYEVLFTKMYRDFANTYRAFNTYTKKENSSINNLSKNFFQDSIVNYKKHLSLILNTIEQEISKEYSNQVLQENTRELHFNETLRLLNINKESLLKILNISEIELREWFSYESANPHKQEKIRSLHNFLETLSEINKENVSLIDYITYSFIDTSDYVFDDEDEDKSPILSYVLSSWNDKTYRELSYETIENYKRKNEWSGDEKLKGVK